MCFTRRKNKIRKNKIYALNVNPYKDYKSINEIKPINKEFIKEFINENIKCYHCKKEFNLGSEEIKIHCAGCDQFFHCGVAGKCRGSQCNLPTMLGNNHRLSWCVNCVPKVDGNEEKPGGIGNCICKECSLSKC